MAKRIQLEYELAQVELEKTQLRLEERGLQLARKELEIKHQLTQLNTVDLTKDETQLKDEFHHTSTDDGQVSIRNVSSDEASVDAPSTLTANSVNAKEKGAVLIEQQDNVIPADKYDSTAAAGEQAAPYADYPPQT